MPRKIFLSFLGINDYEPVSYYMEGGDAVSAPLEKYIQMTLLKYLSHTFTAGDKAYIFVTEEAMSANWLPDGHSNRQTGTAKPNKGLSQEIVDAAFAFPVQCRDVNGKSDEAAIWETFQRVMDCVEEEDEIYLDITHSWRYLPMLAMTLLNYAKVVRKARIGGIYYGAFERLGAAYEVAKMPLEIGMRPVPVLELTNLSLLQDWTVAADDFLKNGDANRLRTLADDAIKPILVETKGQHKAANNLREISKHLSQLIPLILTNRGGEIWKYSYGNLHHALTAFNADDTLIKPMTDIVVKLAEKTSGFRTEGTLQWLEAVRWCHKHHWIQQGITQLQEGVLAWLCEYCEQQPYAPRGYFDQLKEPPRNLLSAVLSFVGNHKGAPPESEWRGEAGRKRALTKLLMQDEIVVKLGPAYSRLGELRNDINHGGYTKKKAAASFSEGLSEMLSVVAAIVEPVELQKRSTPKGLLNVSNHPSGGWSQQQMKAAKQKYGNVTDLPFPNIPPAMDAEAIHDLAAQYLADIRQRNPAAVHLMGEMTFTFTLVNRLQAVGIPCIASTTERIAEERDGHKVVTFRFVQFRGY